MRKLSPAEKLHLSLAMVCLILLVSVAVIGLGMYRVFYNPAYLFREMCIRDRGCCGFPTQR